MKNNLCQWGAAYLFLVALLAALCFHNCKKDTSAMGHSSANFAASDRSEQTDSLMSISALSHQIDAEYEFVGKTIFEHYTYLSDRDPATYFPGMPAGPTAQATQAFNADYKNLTDVQAIVDQMLADSLITSSSDMDFLINYHEDMMEQVDNGSIRS
ncbi:MAG: hypothetical protein ACK4Q5_20635, partial [Saprospiraceae bacterium]